MSQTTVDEPHRITAIDQLRGYAIFGMLAVNASGFFHTSIKLPDPYGRREFIDHLSHFRELFTYADTIAPLFLFVVGMGMRLSWLKRTEKVEPAVARKAMIKRYSLLVLIAFALYAGWLWDALMDIGLAGLIAVWIIDKKPQFRVAAAFVLVAVYQAIVMFTSYGPWIMRQIKFEGDDTPFLVKLIPQHGELFDVALNGGPLGPLSWCMMLLFGTLAYDMLRSGDRKVFVRGCLGWGFGLCVLGYVLSMPWGDFKAEWPISAYYMTAPFPLWATGLCFLQLLAFYFICDKLGFQIPSFTAIGMNPLFLYILQALILDTMGAFKPTEEQMTFPGNVVWFMLFYACFAGLAYWMKRKQIYIKL